MVDLRSFWTVCRTAVLMVCLSLLAGCATDSAPKKTTTADPTTKKTTDDDTLSKQARQMRANSSDEPGTGLSDKSRAIERDLGFH